MDITDIVSTDYVEFDPETPASKLVGRFEDPSLPGVIVRGDAFEGIVTRRQLATSHIQPETKVGSLVAHVPRLAPDEDIRKVAGLMVDSDARLLPVFEGGELTGVVTADAVLRAVEPYLDAATVADTYTRTVASVSPTTSFGAAVNTLREERITHLPVVDDGSLVGVLSLYDVVPLAVRAGSRSQGGNASGRTGRGGFGAREGELSRVLDLPVRDMMTSPARTVRPGATLQEALGEMFEAGGSSLVVTEDDSLEGILTKTDLLDALTWESEGSRAVQVYGTDLLDDTTYEDVVEMIDRLDRMDAGLTVLDAKVHLHEHDERLRGTPLLLARVRLYTDKGLYMASGEGYGASHALNEARDVLERRLRDRKGRDRPQKHRSREAWERRFGWWLEG